MDLKKEAEKEVTRMKKIMSSLKILKENSLSRVLNSYYEDCKKFFEKGQFLQTLEAAYICWAYVDAGLHLGVFEVPEEMKSIFTVG